MRVRPAEPAPAVALEGAASATEARLEAAVALVAAAGPLVGRSPLATSASRNCWEQTTPP